MYLWIYYFAPVISQRYIKYTLVHRILYIDIYIYIIYISGHKWSTTHRVLKSHRSKMSVIYMQSWKQCVLSVITTMALWQLMHLCTWYTVLRNRASCVQVHELPQSHCGDNQEGTLFSWLHIYMIYMYIYIYIYIYICMYSWNLTKIFLDKYCNETMLKDKS